MVPRDWGTRGRRCPATAVNSGRRTEAHRSRRRGRGVMPKSWCCFCVVVLLQSLGQQRAAAAPGLGLLGSCSARCGRSLKFMCDSACWLPCPCPGYGYSSTDTATAPPTATVTTSDSGSDRHSRCMPVCVRCDCGCDGGYQPPRENEKDGHSPSPTHRRRSIPQEVQKSAVLGVCGVCVSVTACASVWWFWLPAPVCVCVCVCGLCCSGWGFSCYSLVVFLVLVLSGKGG